MVQWICKLNKTTSQPSSHAQLTKEGVVSKAADHEPGKIPVGDGLFFLWSAKSGWSANREISSRDSKPINPLGDAKLDLFSIETQADRPK